MKRTIKIIIIMTCFVVISSLHVFAGEASGNIEVGGPAPEFTMYQYKDMTFSTDSVFGKKVVCFIFGSIT